MKTAQKTYFTPELFKFFTQLKKHNNREWFQKNKERYETVARRPLLAFIEELSPRFRKISPRFMVNPNPVGGSMFRIYRDVRFSKDKSPYKTHASAHFSHHKAGGHALGYYLHLDPEESFAAAGSWHPETETLYKIRDGIVEFPKLWKSVLVHHKRYKMEIEGDSLKRPPSGYEPEHLFIEDIKRKDFVVSLSFTQKQVCSAKFMDTFLEACKTMSPLVKFIAKVLDIPY